MRQVIFTTLKAKPLEKWNNIIKKFNSLKKQFKFNLKFQPITEILVPDIIRSKIMTELLKNITKLSNLSLKTPSIFTIKEPLTSERNNTKRLKNVLLKLYNLIKSKLFLMLGWLTVKKNLVISKRPNNITNVHMNSRAILNIKNRKRQCKKR